MGGISYNVGAIYGAGLFVCSMIVGMIVLTSKETISINPKGINHLNGSLH
jgi:hypothetical protein